MAKTKQPAKPAEKKEVKKVEVEVEVEVGVEVGVDNFFRNELYQRIFIALCANPHSSNDVDVLVNQAQCLTVEALKGQDKENF